MYRCCNDDMAVHNRSILVHDIRYLVIDYLIIRVNNGVLLNETDVS